MLAKAGIAGVVGLVFGWIVTAAFIVITVIMLTGRGASLVSGFNWLDQQEKEKYVERKVSIRAGLIMLLLDAALIALMLILHFAASAEMLIYSGIIFSVYVVAVPVAASIGGFGKSVMRDAGTKRKP